MFVAVVVQTFGSWAAGPTVMTMDASSVALVHVLAVVRRLSLWAELGPGKVDAGSELSSSSSNLVEVSRSRNKGYGWHSVAW